MLAKRRAAPVDLPDPALPLALVAPGNGGARLVALNRAARRNGLVVGDLLSNARSKVLDLQCRDADPAADKAALEKLALWAMRYSPTVAVWDETSGADGFFIEVEGSAHLFGGEASLLRDLEQRLLAFGLFPRLAIAGTAGASWAVARFAPTQHAIVEDGAERSAIETLPVGCLRLTQGARSLLRRLGLRSVSQVIDQPRAPFASRFDAEYLRKLDQALGRTCEPLTPVVPEPLYHAQTQFLEPILSAEHVLIAARQLRERLYRELADEQVGARVLRLLLFQVDGDVKFLQLGLAAASRDPEHMARLLGLRLERLAGDFDTDFGFEAAALHALTVEPLATRQSSLGMDQAGAPAESLARMIDRVQQRLGPGAVRQLHPMMSHIPERAEVAGAVAPHEISGEKPSAEMEENLPCAPRPLLLLPHPEAAEVMALIPDGPPRRFRWRGFTHQVAAAEGPERITPQWWERTGAQERDYYMVEDTEGRRFWLFRHGSYGGDAPPSWFVHGFFP
jgi:protein ImuB